MVQALLNTEPGTWPAEPIDPAKPYKYMTRRTVKPQPCTDKNGYVNIKGFWMNPERDKDEAFLNIAPYSIGDVLWVRETWQENNVTSEQDRKEMPYFYRADPDGVLLRSWRPSIHMPREAARITLEVKGVRIERIQDISEEGAKAEGVGKEWLEGWIADNYTEPDENAYWIEGSDQGLSYCRKCGEKEVKRLKKEHPEEYFALNGGYDWQENDWPTSCEICGKRLTFIATRFCVEQEYREWKEDGFRKTDSFLLEQIINDKDLYRDYPDLGRICFMTLWDTLNAKRGYSWESNPFVYVYEFMRVT
jgi:hypothetical protein